VAVGLLYSYQLGNHQIFNNLLFYYSTGSGVSPVELPNSYQLSKVFRTTISILVIYIKPM
ncbi:hypothetical protein, partial [Nostoc sp. DedQUE09]|uniref:hypothetical protein n=1 Tax=Nostoc sp. DedQUE09 TaxID=3075394 RepID=UPI002AD3AEDB